jgi:translation initiation factor IF-2
VDLNDEPTGDETAVTEPVAEGAAAPAVENPEAKEPAAAAAETPAEEPEDKRARRSAESERDQLRKDLEALKAQLEEFKPYADLREVAKKDPARWAAEMAAAMDVTPERVMELVAKRGSGEEAKLSAEERVERLERLLAERDAKAEADRAERERRDSERTAAETRKSNVGVCAAFIKANEKTLSALDESDADAVFSVVEKRWASLPEAERPTDQKGLQALYLDAAKRVDAAARAEIERRSGRLGYSKPTAVTPPEPKQFRGLSLDATTAPAPTNDPDRAHSEEEIDAILARFA